MTPDDDAHAQPTAMLPHPVMVPDDDAHGAAHATRRARRLSRELCVHPRRTSKELRVLARFDALDKLLDPEHKKQEAKRERFRSIKDIIKNSDWAGDQRLLANIEPITPHVPFQSGIRKQHLIASPFGTSFIQRLSPASRILSLIRSPANRQREFRRYLQFETGSPRLHQRGLAANVGDESVAEHGSGSDVSRRPQGGGVAAESEPPSTKHVSWISGPSSDKKDGYDALDIFMVDSAQAADASKPHASPQTAEGGAGMHSPAIPPKRCILRQAPPSREDSLEEFLRRTEDLVPSFIRRAGRC